MFDETLKSSDFVSQVAEDQVGEQLVNRKPQFVHGQLVTVVVRLSVKIVITNFKSCLFTEVLNRTARVESEPVKP